nr:hypothetical protein [Escherichia coli]
MSDNNLRLQVILNAVDKLTRPFRSAQASSRELAAAVKKSRDAIKQLDQAGSSLDSFRKLQAEKSEIRRQAELCPPACKFAQSGTGSDGAAFGNVRLLLWAVNGWLSAPGRTPEKAAAADGACAC